MTDDVKDKPDDLDALLNEIEAEDTKPVETKPVETKPAEAKPPEDISDIRAFIEEQRSKDLATEIGQSVEKMRSADDKLKSLPASVLKGYLEEEARRSPAIQKAWNERRANPERWQRIVGALSKQLADSLSAAPDPQATKDREAARAFVNSQAGAGGSADDDIPPQEKLAAMSAAEFDAYVRQQIKR